MARIPGIRRFFRLPSASQPEVQQGGVTLYPVNFHASEYELDRQK
jgi:hypothetical protein